MTKPEIEDWIKAKGIRDEDFMDSGMIDYITDILVDFQFKIVGDKEDEKCLFESYFTCQHWKDQQYGCEGCKKTFQLIGDKS